MRHMALDAIKDPALVGGKVEIVHTYKCTYFIRQLQEPLRNPA